MLLMTINSNQFIREPSRHTPNGVCSLLSPQTSSVDVFTVLSRYDGHCLLLPAVWNNWQLLSDNWRGLSSGASLSYIVGVQSAAPGGLHAARFIKDDMYDCCFIWKNQSVIYVLECTATPKALLTLLHQRNSNKNDLEVSFDRHHPAQMVTVLPISFQIDWIFHRV